VGGDTGETVGKINQVVGVNVNINKGGNRDDSAINHNWRIINKRSKGVWKQKQSVLKENIISNVNSINELDVAKEIGAVVHHGNSSSIPENQNSFAVLNDSSLATHNDSINEVHTLIINSVDSGPNVLSHINHTSSDIVSVPSTSCLVSGNFSSSSTSFVASSTLPNSIASTSTFCSSQFSTKSPISNFTSPYLHLSPPNHIELPPPSVSDELSEDTTKSGNKIVVNSDDLNNGKNFKPHEVLPLSSSKNNNHHRHTRKNPSPLLPPLPIK
jgi:hypothetical protein